MIRNVFDSETRWASTDFSMERGASGNSNATSKSHSKGAQRQSADNLPEYQFDKDSVCFTSGCADVQPTSRPDLCSRANLSLARTVARVEAPRRDGAGLDAEAARPEDAGGAGAPAEPRECCVGFGACRARESTTQKVMFLKSDTQVVQYDDPWGALGCVPGRLGGVQGGSGRLGSA